MNTAQKAGWQPSWRTLQLIIGIIMLLIVLQLVDWQTLQDAWGQIQWNWVLVASTLVGVFVLLSVYRWYQLLVNRIQVSFWELVRYYLHAQFFLMVIPSFIGADMVRTWDIRRKSQQTSLGLASVMIDRVAGLHAIVTIGMTAAWLSDSAAEYPLVRVLTTGLFLGVTVGWAALLFFPFSRVSRLTARIPRLESFLNNLHNSMGNYRQSPRLMLKMWLLALAAQMIAAVVIYFNTRALADHVSFIEVTSITAILIFTTTIPLAPSALGLQEGAYIVFMDNLGINSSSALLISLIARLQNVVLAVIGGLDMTFNTEN